MTPTFAFDVDPSRDLVHVRLSGFFDEAAIRAYIAGRAVAFSRLTCGPNEHFCVTDVRAMDIQSQDALARWGRMLASPEWKSKRLALVVGSALARMQAQRALASRDARVFTDMAAAEKWALTGVERVAA